MVKLILKSKVRVGVGTIAYYWVPLGAIVYYRVTIILLGTFGYYWVLLSTIGEVLTQKNENCVQTHSVESVWLIQW